MRVRRVEAAGRSCSARGTSQRDALGPRLLASSGWIEVRASCMGALIAVGDVDLVVERTRDAGRASDPQGPRGGRGCASPGSSPSSMTSARPRVALRAAGDVVEVDGVDGAVPNPFT